jgi:hypothetical protein
LKSPASDFFYTILEKGLKAMTMDSLIILRFGIQIEESFGGFTFIQHDTAGDSIRKPNPHLDKAFSG